MCGGGEQYFAFRASHHGRFFLGAGNPNEFSEAGVNDVAQV